MKPHQLRYMLQQVKMHSCSALTALPANSALQLVPMACMGFLPVPWPVASISKFKTMAHCAVAQAPGTRSKDTVMAGIPAGSAYDAAPQRQQLMLDLLRQVLAIEQCSKPVLSVLHDIMEASAGPVRQPIICNQPRL